MKTIFLPVLLAVFSAQSVQSQTSLISAANKDRIDSFNKTPDKDSVAKRKDDSKFVEVSKISLYFENPEVDYQEFQINERDDIKAAMNAEEEKWLKKELKAQEKETYVSASKEKQQISIDYTIFTKLASDTLHYLGYSDTVKSIYPDNLNTVFIEGKILKIHEFLIKVGSTDKNAYYKLKMYMKWYVKNIYGETLDSISTIELSDKFDDYFSYPHFTTIDLINTVESGVANSIFGLFNEPLFQNT